MIKNLLCKLGFHKWKSPRSHYISGSNVIDYETYCLRCNKKKRWAKPKNE